MSVTHNFQQLIEQLPDGVVLHDRDTILYANGVANTMLELPSPLPSAVSVSQQLDPVSREAWLHACEKQLGQPDHNQRVELKLQTQEVATHVEASLSTLILDDTPLLLTTMRDISEQKRQEERIRHAANYDALTSLPNRALFLDRLKQELVRANRADSRVALMFIDLDRFKWVNDTLGHGAGDELLRETAKRLLLCHRQSDTVARLGGDEFTVILPDMARGPHAERVAAQIIEQLVTPFHLEGQEVGISGSVGVTIYPDDADNLDDLLKNADTAMYRAKTEGRNAYRFFTQDMHAEAIARMELEKDLHTVVSDGALALFYQPIYDLKTNKLAGAEALLRWTHSTRGAVSPEIFIPLAEEVGLIAEITEWALNEACRQAKVWRDAHPEATDFFISVNLTCTRCRELSTDDMIPDILKKHDLPPQALTLEITENILSEDKERAMLMLTQLREIGVRLWLDDFGTGFSSLSVLRSLPVTGVKIDRTFVPDAIHDKEAAVLVSTIVNMGHSLEHSLIGEGVENEAQMLFLKSHGCEYAQGYFYGKPCAADEFHFNYLK
uniref:Putative Diguanylate cyclase/phosphodiesterase with PYP-like sensor domain (PAS domain) n=1 Tax=Magnetococcus massalia (strain MO-1) TaxID=451514 RepID=A0A1S7LD72_MAGMO|nr:Putative Diguanylate cyclase/phosphodiesterase with PYP-like sensor domain (PAS domain) [Candidatus Magnetococcus massalia]